MVFTIKYRGLANPMRDLIDIFMAKQTYIDGELTVGP